MILYSRNTFELHTLFISYREHKTFTPENMKLMQHVQMDLGPFFGLMKTHLEILDGFQALMNRLELETVEITLGSEGDPQRIGVEVTPGGKDVCKVCTKSLELFKADCRTFFPSCEFIVIIDVSGSKGLNEKGDGSCWTEDQF